MEAPGPYGSRTEPVLRPSIVCHIDMLGYRDLIQEAMNHDGGTQLLRRLSVALSRAYDRMVEAAEGWGGSANLFEFKTFTDNIVIGYPLHDPVHDDAEAELGHVLMLTAEFQAAMVMDGFLLRGGIAVGAHHQARDVVFGQAFLEAQSLDARGGSPRIVLSPFGAELVGVHLGSYGSVRDSPHFQYLLQDADGALFVNYLHMAVADVPDFGPNLELVRRHAEVLHDGLARYAAVPRVRAKFEWAARYHNFWCLDVADRYPVPEGPDADPEYSAAAEKLQELRRHTIDTDELGSAPRRISLAPRKAND